VQLRIVGMDRPAPSMFSGMGKMASEVIRAMMGRHADRVHLTGHVPLSQLVEYYRSSYMTLMPTRGFESFSYTLCEAMSCGSAVVATRCGGPGEIVTDGVDGLLTEPGDAAGLSAAIERLLSEPGLRKKLADNARETIIRRFSNDAVIPQICRCYQEAVAGFDNRARGR
jgi:glycosyltransferase involved in cell wall biosynthesis